MIPQSVLDFFHAGKSLPFRSMTYFNFLLEATLAGSILILVVMVLRRVFRKKIGSRLVYLAWALVAVRLLLPIAIPNPLMDELRPTYSTDAEARPVADQIRVRYQDTMHSIAYTLSESAYESDSPVAQGAATLAHELSTYTSYGWLGKAYLLLYAAGGLIVLAVFGARHTRFRRRLKRDEVGTLEGEQLALYRQLCGRLHVKPLPVVLVDPLPSPCLVGVLKPMIALPLTLPPDALSEALMHELCHYKARDPWWVLLKCVCCAVHWFNPLVWLAQRFVKVDCELACDERVAAKLSDDERLHYANTLVTTAKHAYEPRAGVLSTGMTMTGKRLMRRVNALLHMKAVQRVVASVTACVLVALTVAAFSTAESTERTAYLTSDRSAFPFEKGDIYTVPQTTFGAPVERVPLPDAAQAEAQAKRYILALFPDEKDVEQCTYSVNVLGKRTWEIAVWPPEGGDTPRYYISLRSGGGLIQINSSDRFSNGDDRINSPSVLPDNLTDALLPFGQSISDAILGGAAMDMCVIHGDYDTPDFRFIGCDFYDDKGMIPLTLELEIAPEFSLIGVYTIENNGVIDEAANPQIESVPQRLVYSKDASVAFDATYWGQTQSQYVISPDAALTLRQAFDTAVDAVLERSGLSKEQLIELPLSYGYLDKSNFGGEWSDWRFEWSADPDDPMNRYWISFSDKSEPTDISYSAPGEGLG